MSDFNITELYRSDNVFHVSGTVDSAKISDTVDFSWTPSKANYNGSALPYQIDTNFLTPNAETIDSGFPYVWTTIESLDHFPENDQLEGHFLSDSQSIYVVLSTDIIFGFPGYSAPAFHEIKPMTNTILPSIYDVTQVTLSGVLLSGTDVYPHGSGTQLAWYANPLTDGLSAILEDDSFYEFGTVMSAYQLSSISLSSNQTVDTSYTILLSGAGPDESWRTTASYTYFPVYNTVYTLINPDGNSVSAAGSINRDNAAIPDTDMISWNIDYTESDVYTDTVSAFSAWPLELGNLIPFDATRWSVADTAANIRNIYIQVGDYTKTYSIGISAVENVFYGELFSPSYEMTLDSTQVLTIGQVDLRNEVNKYVARTVGNTIIGGLPYTPDTTPFTIVHIGDTQWLARDAVDGSPAGEQARYNAMMQWIVDNKIAKNIKMVISTGDVVDSQNYTPEYESAQEAFDILDDADIPCLISPGNHDYNVVWPCPTGLTNFNTYFPDTRFTSKEWFGGQYASGEAEAVWYNFDHNGINYIFIGVPIFPEDDVLAWVEDVVEDNIHSVITLCIHSYIEDDGAGPYYDDYMFPGCSVPPKNTGESVWDKVVSQHDNIHLVLCGHNHDRTTMLPDINISGNNVMAIQNDYSKLEYEVRDAMMLIEVDPVTDLATTSVYSNTTGYITDVGNENTTFDFASRTERVLTDLHTINEGQTLIWDFSGGANTFVNLICDGALTTDIYIYNKEGSLIPYTSVSGFAGILDTLDISVPVNEWAGYGELQERVYSFSVSAVSSTNVPPDPFPVFPIVHSGGLIQLDLAGATNVIWNTNNMEYTGTSFNTTIDDPGIVYCYCDDFGVGTFVSYIEDLYVGSLSDVPSGLADYYADYSPNLVGDIAEISHIKSIVSILSADEIYGDIAALSAVEEEIHLTDCSYISGEIDSLVAQEIYLDETKVTGVAGAPDMSIISLDNTNLTKDDLENSLINLVSFGVADGSFTCKENMPTVTSTHACSAITVLTDRGWTLVINSDCSPY